MALTIFRSRQRNGRMDHAQPHKLLWTPGQEGKGFFLKPSPHFPNLANEPPIVWTWPTENMRPTHAQMGVRTTQETPQGMLPEESSFFHITPEGGVWTHGNIRQVTPEDHAILRTADPRLHPVGQTPVAESDSYGHANRLLEILGALRRGRWTEWPSRWH